MSLKTEPAASPLSILAHISFDPPRSVLPGLDLVFLRGESSPRSPVRLLHEVPEGLVIEERGGGTVPVLVARNVTDAPILIVAGQLIRGGKQNRGINADALIPAGCTLDIPVTCVEQGRWSNGGIGNFRPLGIEPHFIRSAKMRDLSSSRRRSTASHEERGVAAEHLADQHQVWQEIHRYREVSRSQSPSADLLSILDQDLGKESRPLDLASIRAEAKGACGVLTFIDGEFVAGDLFGKSGWFDGFLDDLLRSAHSSHRFVRLRRKVDGPGGVTRDPASVSNAAETVLDGLASGHWNPHRPIGHERAWQIDHPFLEASATFDGEGEALHVLVGTRHQPSIFR